MTSTTEREVRAYGQPDDHLRLAVELARALQAPEDDPIFEPTQHWNDRLGALEERLRGEVPALHFVDPDALSVGQREGDPWDDWAFGRQRSELLEVLLRSMRRGWLRHWRLSRPEPDPHVTMELPIGEPEDPNDADWLGVAPALRPIARAVVERGLMSAERLLDTLDEATPSEPLLLSLSYDALPRRLRAAAIQLCVPRGPQALNGTVGPFEWGDSATRQDLDMLSGWGWVVRRGSAYEMCRSVRQFLLARATAQPEQLRDRHARVAEVVDSDLERHHHAVEAGDADLALQTAKHYGSDLRLLARHRSIIDHDFTEAARLYRTVVERFDDTDAYAWEYYAYNLARSLGDQVGKTDRETIRKAYEKACELEPTNPLYRGRWFAFRIRSGERVAPELLRYARYFSQPQFSSDALSYLCERPLREFKSLFRDDEIAEVRDKAPRALIRHETIRPLLGN